LACLQDQSEKFTSFELQFETVEHKTGYERKNKAEMYEDRRKCPKIDDVQKNEVKAEMMRKNRNKQDRDRRKTKMGLTEEGKTSTKPVRKRGWDGRQLKQVEMPDARQRC
jgi:hypothetical protein